MSTFIKKATSKVLSCIPDGDGEGVRVRSGDAMMLGKLVVPGRPTNVDNSGTRASCACGGCRWGLLDIFSLFCRFSLFSPFCGRRLEID